VVRDGVLTEVPASFELYNGPRQINVRTIVTNSGSANGFVVFGSRVNRNGASGATSWTSADGGDFTIFDNDPALSSGPNEFNLGLDIANDGRGYLAVGERMRVVPGAVDVDAIAWRSDDGVTWSRWLPTGLNLGGKHDQRAQRVAVHTAAGKIVLAGTETDAKLSKFVVWSRHSANGSWHRQVIPSSVIAASADPLSTVSCLHVAPRLTIVCARSGDKLVAASSNDGRTWQRVVLPAGLPTGQRATLTIAEADGVRLIGATGPTGGGLWTSRLK
jgi:hypothetical protein